MMKKWCLLLAVLMALALALPGCSQKDEAVKIGVSFGVGAATRWDQEQQYMIDRAKELGAEIEVRLNRTDTPKTQEEDCMELIDSGIDVLILTPRDVNKVANILDYAKEKKVKVISYARVVLGQSVDLLVGYDNERIGQKMGQYLSEAAYEGNYIILQGDSGDNNSSLLYQGVMRYLDPMKGKINILLDAPVPGWDPNEAETMVENAIKNANGKIDAILAPNDKIAEACAAVVERLGIQNHVAITGMDAELSAIRRIIAGKQDMTIYMDLKELASTAINEAYHMAKGENVNVNAEFDNHSGAPIDANLITGQMVVKENIDRILIDGGYFTHEEVYGPN